jgi:hypothetical protein
MNVRGGDRHMAPIGFFFFFMEHTNKSIGELERTGPADGGAVGLPE